MKGGWSTIVIIYHPCLIYKRGEGLLETLSCLDLSLESRIGKNGYTGTCSENWRKLD